MGSVPNGAFGFKLLRIRRIERGINSSVTCPAFTQASRDYEGDRVKDVDAYINKNPGTKKDEHGNIK